MTPSRFTAVLVDGLASGQADVDGDGFVTVDDAYDFVRRRLADDGVPQSPRKWEFDVSGRHRAGADGGGAGHACRTATAGRPAPPGRARSARAFGRRGG